MPSGNEEFNDAAAIPGEGKVIPDWLNLPPGSHPTSLWNSLHDAEIISIRSSLLDRTMELLIEIGHLRDFHQLGEGFQFLIQLECVQSARVLHYAIWPGQFSAPPEISREEETRLVLEYQAKWREESASWNEFEAAIAHGNKHLFCIHDAAIMTSHDGLLALKLCGQLDHSKYHGVFLRAERLNIVGNNGRIYSIDEFRKLGESYWEAFSSRGNLA